MCVIGALEGKRKWTENIFKEMMGENPNWWKIKLCIHILETHSQTDKNQRWAKVYK